MSFGEEHDNLGVNEDKEQRTIYRAGVDGLFHVGVIPHQHHYVLFSGCGGGFRGCYTAEYYSCNIHMPVGSTNTNISLVMFLGLFL